MFLNSCGYDLQLSERNNAISMLTAQIAQHIYNHLCAMLARLMHLLSKSTGDLGTSVNRFGHEAHQCPRVMRGLCAEVEFSKHPRLLVIFSHPHSNPTKSSLQVRMFRDALRYGTLEFCFP